MPRMISIIDRPLLISVDGSSAWTVHFGALHTHADLSVAFADISPIAQVLNIKSLQVTIARYYEKNILGMNTTFWTFVIAIDIAYLLC